MGWFHFWNILLKTALKQHTFPPSSILPPLLFFYLTRKILFTERFSSLRLTQSTINYNASNFIILTFFPSSSASSSSRATLATIYHQIERLNQLQQLRSSRRCRGSNILQHFCHRRRFRRRRRRRPTAAISHAPHNLLCTIRRGPFKNPARKRNKT